MLGTRVSWINVGFLPPHDGCMQRCALQVEHKMQSSEAGEHGITLHLRKVSRVCLSCFVIFSNVL